LKATAKPRIQDVLAEGRMAWHKSGYDVIDLVGAEVVAEIDGERKRGVFSELAG
jgi:hypothetical protein